MQKKKILYCESNVDGTVGGSFFSLLYLIEGLDKSRYAPTAVFYREHTLLPEYRRAGAETVVMPLPEPTHLDQTWMGGLYRIAPLRLVLRVIQRVINFVKFVPLQAYRCARYLRTHRIDLVHLNNSILKNHDWMLAALLTGTKCMTHERGIRKHYPWLAKFFARRLDAVICISGAVRQNLLDRGVRGARFAVIFNGVDPRKVQAQRDASAVRAELGIGAEQPVIGILGNIREWKGQETVVRATAQLRSAFPNIVCLLVGDTAQADSHYEVTLRKFIAEHGLERNVLFTGYKKHVADYIQLMDIVIHASIDPEPFGRVLIEAMAMRKPLIGSHGGAVPEIVEQGVTGMTFTPGDAQALAQYAARLLSDTASRREMGERAFARLTEHFHVQANVARTQEIYERLFAAGEIPVTIPSTTSSIQSQASTHD